MPTFSPAPPPQPKVRIRSKVPSVATASKQPKIRRRPLDDDTEVYGDALFESAMKPQKSVFITFYDMLENNFRISVCRKYAIEYFPFHHEEVIETELEDGKLPIKVWREAWSLYYFKDKPSPLMAYNCDLDKRFDLPIDKATEVFLTLFSIDKLKDKIVELEIIEQLEERKRKLEESRLGAENVTDTTGNGNNEESITDYITENEGEKKESISEEAVQSETNKEEAGQNFQEQ